MEPRSVLPFPDLKLLGGSGEPGREPGSTAERNLPPWNYSASICVSTRVLQRVDWEQGRQWSWEAQPAQRPLGNVGLLGDIAKSKAETVCSRLPNWLTPAMRHWQESPQSFKLVVRIPIRPQETSSLSRCCACSAPSGQADIGNRVMQSVKGKNYPVGHESRGPSLCVPIFTGRLALRTPATP